MKIRNWKFRTSLLAIVFVTVFFALPVFAACPEGKTAVIGNSLGLGIGNELKRDCPNVDVYAESGAFIATGGTSIKGQFEDNVSGKDYDQVIIMGGYNDAHAGKTAGSIEQNLDDLYDNAGQEGLSVTAMTIPSTENANPDTVNAVNSRIKAIAPGETIDAAAEWNQTGEVHNSNSYKKVAGVIEGTAPSPSPSPSPSIQSNAPDSTTLLAGNDFCEMWKNAFNLGVSLIGVAALLGVVFGGFTYITSYGNPEKTKSAKEIIWGSVAGMFIGLFTYVFFSLVNPFVLECKVEVPFTIGVTESTSGPSDPTDPTGPTEPTTDIKKCDKTYNPDNPGSHGYGHIIQEASRKFGVDPFFVESTIQHESNFNNSAGSGAGAKSMGQFMPNTFAAAARKWGGSIDQSCFSPINRTTFAPKCLQWIGQNPKKIPEIVAAEISRIKSKIPSDNYACIAAGYVGGPGEAHNERAGTYSGGRAYCNGRNVDSGTTRYVNNATTAYNKSCQGGQ